MLFRAFTIFTLLSLFASHKGKKDAGGWVNPVWQHCRHCGAQNNVGGFQDKAWDCWSCGKTNNDR